MVPVRSGGRSRGIGMFVSIIKTLATTILGITVIPLVCGKKRLAASWAKLGHAPAMPVAIPRTFGVDGCVLAMGHQDQVVQSVARTNAVNMMNNFASGYRAAKMFGHHEPMLSDVTDVTLFKGVWVFRPQKINIAISCNKSAALPIWVAFSSVGMARNKTRVVTLGDSPQRRRARGKRLAASTFAFHNEGCPFTGIIYRSRHLSQGDRYA